MASTLERILAQRAAQEAANDAWYQARSQSEPDIQQKMRATAATAPISPFRYWWNSGVENRQREAEANRAAQATAIQGTRENAYDPLGNIYNFFAGSVDPATGAPVGNDPRSQQAIAKMQAAAIQQPMPGDMPAGAPIPQQAYGPAFGGGQSPAGADPNSPTGSNAPRPPLRAGGMMPNTTPDMIQTGMAPVGGSAGPGTEAPPQFTPESPTGPAPAQPPSEARGIMEEMMRNRGSNAPWLALAAAGFGTAAGTSPHAMTNIGQGGLKGLEFYDRMSDRAARDRLAAAQSIIGAEQQDRQAGFREREIGQGERRLGYEGQRVENERLNQKQQRENDAAKLRHDELKLRQDEPVKRAQANMYDANAEYTREQKGKGQDDARMSLIIDRIDKRASSVADSMHGKDPSMRDNDAWRETFETERRRIADANKIPLEMLGLDSAPSAPPPQKRKPNAVYQTPKGPMRWTGTGWLPAE